MRERCKDNPRREARRSGTARLIGSSLWTHATKRPMDTFALLGASAATVVIVVNAVFLQSGARSAPFVATPAATSAVADLTPSPAAQDTLKSADMVPAHTAAISPRPQAAAPLPATVPLPPRRNDPIANLIGSSQQRIKGVQRALSEYGYGQLKPTGGLDDITRRAIEKFERDHGLPITGRISEKLVSVLGEMAGHPID